MLNSCFFFSVETKHNQTQPNNGKRCSTWAISWNALIFLRLSGSIESVYFLLLIGFMAKFHWFSMSFSADWCFQCHDEQPNACPIIALHKMTCHYRFDRNSMNERLEWISAIIFNNHRTIDDNDDAVPSTIHVYYSHAYRNMFPYLIHVRESSVTVFQ